MIKKFYAVNIAMVKAMVSSYIFLVEFSYFVLLNNVKDKKNMIISTTISYFMMMWFIEYIKIIGVK